MTPDEKEPFKVEAAHQQQVLDKLEEQALPSAADKEAGRTEGSEAWRNASKKRSLRRLDLNMASYEEHPIWQLETQLGDSAWVDPQNYN